MKQDSLWQIILEMLAAKAEWVNGGEVERLALEHGYKASNASRRCREMAEEGLILREERMGDRARSVWYRINDQKVVTI